VFPKVSARERKRAQERDIAVDSQASCLKTREGTVPTLNNIFKAPLKSWQTPVELHLQ
jgi:hypothetical protein